MGGGPGAGVPGPTARCPTAPTYHTHDGRPSLLGYISTNRRLSPNMVSWDVHDEGDNLSDHSPTTMVLKVATCAVSGIPDPPLGKSYCRAKTGVQPNS